ncbi:hypothetical protein PPQ05_001031 [Salmonella enterica]|uniref:Uncharacterized protein n=1 Tax=Salmonella enterica TaxID=28901 RepID=A0A5V4X1J6_SALER|nr:hypothetical protein [Salmonella enterica]EBS4769350.1 hypothetical protein [Salmonella enterica subsp. enterica serovar Sandiego]EBY0067064.1 hypothetical protein [Salmonella enterica subsp. enterica serovar Bonariensis]ECB0373108.1 hypothetical protein [Salmonella enterica subsp. enterica serovar Muenchen]ECU4586514.1 hypothetical protein [Salmonella enterica subsp. enterica]ECU9089535.1 hypothetical protein [Salmonella enterica subsp. enterica serovar Cotham]EDQ5101753.1 hypothetical pr
MLITMEHIRAGGGCAWGLRTFFARYNLDLEAFIRDGGINSELLAGTGDALAIQIVELAQQTQKEAGA